jgi:hypothetical protein
MPGAAEHEAGFGLAEAGSGGLAYLAERAGVWLPAMTLRGVSFS